MQALRRETPQPNYPLRFVMCVMQYRRADGCLRAERVTDRGSESSPEHADKVSHGFRLIADGRVQRYSASVRAQYNETRIWLNERRTCNSAPATRLNSRLTCRQRARSICTSQTADMRAQYPPNAKLRRYETVCQCSTALNLNTTYPFRVVMSN